MRVFFDTSSFVKRFVEEVGSQQADEITQQATEIGLSVICFPELISALNGKLRSNLMDNSTYQTLKKDILEDIKDAQIINLTPSVIEKSSWLLETNTLRSLDALHIACALEWQAEIFVSSDERQVTAAHRAGLCVEYIEGVRAQ